MIPIYLLYLYTSIYFVYRGEVRMKKKVRMADIADKLNVSVVTVSKALGDKSGVSEDVRAAIKKLAEEMGYHSSTTSVNTNKTIGVIMPERFGNLTQHWQSLYIRMFHMLHQEIQTKGYYVLWETITQENEANQIAPRFCTQRRVEGIIIIGQPSDDYLQSLSELDIQMVFLDFYNTKFPVDCIITDNFFSTSELTNYLIDNGHKQIGFVGDIRFSSSVQDRYWGYRKALSQHNINFNESYIILDRDLSSFEAFSDFNLPEDMPTAFVCSSDYIADLFIRYLEQHGYRVPEDISVVGFDDDIYASLTEHKLTTMQIDLAAMTSRTASAIIDKIENQSPYRGKIIVSPKIVYGNTVKNIN